MIGGRRRKDHNSRSTNAARTRTTPPAGSFCCQISGAPGSAILDVLRKLFHLSRPLCSLVLCMDSALGLARTWAPPRYSRRVCCRRFFAWPEFAASVRSLCPRSSAPSRWLRGAAGPLRGPSRTAGGWGSRARRRPPDSPAPSDRRASTDTRPSPVSPARRP